MYFIIFQIARDWGFYLEACIINQQQYMTNYNKNRFHFVDYWILVGNYIEASKSLSIFRR